MERNETRIIEMNRRKGKLRQRKTKSNCQDVAQMEGSMRNIRKYECKNEYVKSSDV